MATPAEHPLARRYRAARAWADLEQEELAERLGVDRQTVIRREKGSQLPKRAELLALATICGVPADFMLHGFTTEILTAATGFSPEQREALEAAARLLAGVAQEPAQAEQPPRAASDDPGPTDGAG